MNIHQYPHGRKIDRRIREYPDQRELFKDLKVIYEGFRKDAESLIITPENYHEELPKLANIINEYLYVFTTAKYNPIKIEGRSKIYPAISEESVRYVLKDLVVPPFFCGSCRIPVSITRKVHPFKSKNYEDNFAYTYFNADFVIGVLLKSYTEKGNIVHPIVVIENKKYSDFCMRRGLDTLAKSMKQLHENCAFYQIVDFFKGTYNQKCFMPQNEHADQVFALMDNDENIRPDILIMIFEYVSAHLMKVLNKVTWDERFRRGFLKEDDRIISMGGTYSSRSIAKRSSDLIKEGVLTIE